MLHCILRRGASIGLGSLLLLPSIALAASNPSPIGTLRCDGMVYVGGEKAGPETSLFNGDQVTTGEGHAALSLSRGNRAVIDFHSSAVLRSSSGGLALGLEKGKMAWLADPQAPFQVKADGLTLVPSGSFPALAEVSMRNDGSLAVAVHKGAISIHDLRADPIVITAGKIITINPRLSRKPTPTTRPIGMGAHGKMTLREKLRTFHIGSLSHTASVAVLFGAVGGTAAAIIVPLSGGEKASPSVP